MALPEIKLRAPLAEPETEAFWQAAEEGRFLLRHCNACGELHHYPRFFCPFCMSRDLDWRESTGEGVIYTFTVNSRNMVPFAPGMVTLDEGVTVPTAFVDCDFSQLQVGQRVKVVYLPSEGGAPIPFFRPL